MIVNVGLSYTEINKNKKINRSMNIKVEFEGDWNNREDHEIFRTKIQEQYQGKRIVGYALPENQEEIE